MNETFYSNYLNAQDIATRAFAHSREDTMNTIEVFKRLVNSARLHFLRYFSHVLLQCSLRMSRNKSENWANWDIEDGCESDPPSADVAVYAGVLIDGGNLIHERAIRKSVSIIALLITPFANATPPPIYL